MLDVRHIATFETAEKFLDEMNEDLERMIQDVPRNEVGKYFGPAWERWKRRYDEVVAAERYLKRLGVYWEERDSEPWYI